MLSSPFRKLVDLSPKLSHFGWKYFYEFIALRVKNNAGWKFMNYGYADEREQSSDYNLLCGNMYRHLVELVSINNQTDACEIGCGRGGGCELLLEYHPASVTGLDFSKNVIEFCNNNYHDERLNFIAGDAEQLPFNSESFDIILNVESSHCYGNRQNFFLEVARTLKPSGYFLYADFMGRVHYHKRAAQLKACGLEVLSEREITPQVLKSMDLSKTYKEMLIKKNVLKPFRKSIADFTGLPGSDIYNKFATGHTIYFSMVCRKI